MAYRTLQEAIGERAKTHRPRGECENVLKLFAGEEAVAKWLEATSRLQVLRGVSVFR